MCSGRILLSFRTKAYNSTTTPNQTFKYHTTMLINTPSDSSEAEENRSKMHASTETTERDRDTMLNALMLGHESKQPICILHAGTPEDLIIIAEAKKALGEHAVIGLGIHEFERAKEMGFTTILMLVDHKDEVYMGEPKFPDLKSISERVDFALRGIYPETKFITDSPSPIFDSKIKKGKKGFRWRR